MIASIAGLNPKLLHQPNFPRLNHTIVDQIKKCSSSVDLQHIYTTMIKTSASQDSFLTNQFITACVTFYRIDFAVLAFSEIQNPNVFVYNAIIRGFCHCGYPIQALDYYKHMLRTSVAPSSYTFPSIVKASGSVSSSGFGESVHGNIWKCGFDSHVYVQTALMHFYSNSSRLSEAGKVFDEMTERDDFAWTTMVSCYARVGNLTCARSLFDEMPRRNTATWNCMIDGYARVGIVESAELLYSLMPAKDIISWTTMITCYCQNKRYREALAVFDEMTFNGISPDAVTMSAVISACAHLGALDLGKQIHIYMMQNGFDIDVFIGSALVDMYAKCGSLERSLLVFFKLEERNLFCWNSIIEGLAAHGHAQEALRMFNKMEHEKINPNGITFISVLSACTHAGLAQEGRKIFESMTCNYGITPQIKHYGCMVDLLSKAGLLNEALEFTRTMKFKPNSYIWGALLCGCKLHKNLEIAKVAVSELMVLEPTNSGYFALLLNLYAEANRWVDVAVVRARMKELGVEKQSPGSSSIEIERKVHQFAASDDSHFASDEIFSLVDELDGQLKLHGELGYI